MATSLMILKLLLLGLKGWYIPCCPQCQYFNVIGYIQRVREYEYQEIKVADNVNDIPRILEVVGRTAIGTDQLIF